MPEPAEPTSSILFTQPMGLVDDEEQRHSYSRDLALT
jgi:hypothetical protein